MGFTRDELEACRGLTVPDLVGDVVRLVLVGINPSLTTAATGTHFAHPSNRFYPALHRAGITPSPLPRGVTHDDEQRARLTDHGIAITNLVARATARADELTAAELRAGGRDLEERLEDWSPRVVAFVGLGAYRAAFRHGRVAPGRQRESLAGAQVWAVPNPSGLNAHESVDSLARWYGAVADAAGVRRVDVRP
jgi:double-stranded uracil-DNA glycosylase